MSTNREFDYKSITELRHLLDSRAISSYELTERFLNRSEELASYGVFITPPDDSILIEAEKADEAIKHSNGKGILTGIPVPVKDMESVKGLPFTHGSLPYKNLISDNDSLTVRRIKNSGGIVAGKTNTPENGFSGTTENRICGPARNPWDRDKTPGGSSGGSAVAVASGLSPFSPGGDGGGSVRIPAGFTGIYGIKPTQGRSPRYQTGRGSFNITNNSSPGPLTRTVSDSAITLSIISGFDPQAEYGASTLEVPDFFAGIDADVTGMKAGWATTIGGNPVEPEILDLGERAAKIFESLGIAVEEVNFSPGTYEEIFQTWFDYFCVKGFYVYEKDYKKTPDLLTDYFFGYMEHAQSISGKRMWEVNCNMGWYRNYTNVFFDDYDFLLTPTLAVPAFKINDQPAVINGQQVIHPLWGFTPYSYLFNLTGNPAATIPIGFSSSGLPVGLQIVGDMWSEETILSASKRFEDVKPWGQYKPEI